MNINRDFILKLINDIMKSIDTINSYYSKPFNEINITERYAVRYHIIVIAEALIALALHITRRVYNVTPESPIHALNVLKDRNLLNYDEYSGIISIFRLRNLLVHRYWNIIDEKIYDNVKGDFTNIINFIERIKHVFKI